MVRKPRETASCSEIIVALLMVGPLTLLCSDLTMGRGLVAQHSKCDLVLESGLVGRGLETVCVTPPSSLHLTHHSSIVSRIHSDSEDEVFVAAS